MIYETELYHHGVLGMKWGHRKARPEALSAQKGDSRVTKRVKSDYNKLSDGDMIKRNDHRGHAPTVPEAPRRNSKYSI